MLKNWFRLRVGLTTPWLMLFLLAFGPATRSAMAVDGIVTLPQGTLYSLAPGLSSCHSKRCCHCSRKA